MEAVVPVLQDVVGAPAHNDTGALVRQVPNHPVLNGPQEVRGGHPAHGPGDAAAQKGVGEAVPAGGELPLLLNELGIEAALQRYLLDQLLVVVWDVQLLGDPLADGASAASELAADGDDLLFHSQNLLVMMGGPPGYRRDCGWGEARRLWRYPYYNAYETKPQAWKAKDCREKSKNS